MKNTHWKLAAAVIPLAALVLAGCPEDTEYDFGFDAGFAEDDEYWAGYDDGWFTEDDDPVYYSGGEIPYVTTPPYDAGYWDGVWYAYNDGYFVDYDYAFTIGWSEGYDAAFYDDYLDFLDSDVHIEYDNGGWGDGYMDGFSEGRIFGAADYEAGLSFDWLDALDDYRSGTDLYFEEIDLGTGEYGPVWLYEYGTDPFGAKAARSLAKRPVPAIRSNGLKAEIPPISYRTLVGERRDELIFVPTTVSRNGYPPRLTTTWLDRINAYLGATKAAEAKSADAKPKRPRAVTP